MTGAFASVSPAIIEAARQAKIIATIKPYTTVINEALSRLQSLKKTIDSREKEVPGGLNKQEIELKQLQSTLDNLDIQITDTKESINDILSGRRLLKFIDDRARDENYNNALGVISWIRRDFIALDKLSRCRSN